MTDLLFFMLVLALLLPSKGSTRSLCLPITLNFEATSSRIQLTLQYVATSSFFFEYADSSLVFADLYFFPLQAGMLPFKESFHTFPILKELSFRLRGTVFEFAQAHPPWCAPETAWREFRILLEYYQVQRTSVKKAEEEKARAAAEATKREADRAEKAAAKREADRLKRQAKSKAKKGKVRFSILGLFSRISPCSNPEFFQRLSSPRPSSSRIQKKKTFLTRTRVRPGTFSIPTLPLTRYFLQNSTGSLKSS